MKNIATTSHMRRGGGRRASPRWQTLCACRGWPLGLGGLLMGWLRTKSTGSGGGRPVIRAATAQLHLEGVYSTYSPDTAV